MRRISLPLALGVLFSRKMLPGEHRFARNVLWSLYCVEDSNVDLSFGDDKQDVNLYDNDRILVLHSGLSLSLHFIKHPFMSI